VRSLRAQVGIAGSLKELKGVSQNDFEALAALAMKDSCMSTNPVSPDPEQVIAVYRTAYCGK
jgi:alcohol dehydrogenase class IV